MLYKIKVQEFLTREIEVEADSKNEAIAKAERMYSNEDIILDYNDVDYVDFVECK